MSLRKILKEIYNGAANELMETKQDALKDKHSIENAMVKYSNHRASKCQICNDHDPQHQEFPGWIGALKYNNNGKIENKDIIVFGLEPATKETTEKVLRNKYEFQKKFNLNFSFIHIWYELGYDKTELDLKNNKKYTNHLFDYLNIIFKPLSKYLERMYGTDLGKCYTRKNWESRKRCSTEFLPKELGCFEEKEITFILQGKDSKPILNQFFRFSEDHNFISFLDKNEKEVNNFGIECNNKFKEYNFEIGSFNPRGSKEINLFGRYLLIPHSSGRTRDKWKKMASYIKDSYIENELLKEVISKIRNYFSLEGD